MRNSAKSGLEAKSQKFLTFVCPAFPFALENSESDGIATHSITKIAFPARIKSAALDLLVG
jgi:hypothetical protein